MVSPPKFQVDDLLYSVALLGASHLQAHPSAAVRQLAGRALRHLMASQCLAGGGWWTWRYGGFPPKMRLPPYIIIASWFISWENPTKMG